MNDSCHAVPEAWVQTVIPSSSQVTEESSRSDAEPKSQTTISSSIPLPGSIMDYMDELQMHPPCAAKSAAIVEEAGCGKHSVPDTNKIAPFVSVLYTLSTLTSDTNEQEMFEVHGLDGLDPECSSIG